MLEMNKRIIIGTLLVLLIIGMAIFCFMNKDKLFSSDINVTYPNGCTEHFVDKQLVSPSCGCVLNVGSKDYICPVKSLV